MSTGNNCHFVCLVLARMSTLKVLVESIAVLSFRFVLQKKKYLKEKSRFKLTRLPYVVIQIVHICNYYPLEVMSCCHDQQLQMSKNFINNVALQGLISLTRPAPMRTLNNWISKCHITFISTIHLCNKTMTKIISLASHQ